MALQDWLGWWTVTEARQRLDTLQEERGRLLLDMKLLAIEFKKEFRDEDNLPARLAIGTVTSVYGGRAMTWRRRGVKGSGQTWVGFATQKSRELIDSLPPAWRPRWLKYERRGFWLNAALGIRDREIKFLKDYLVVLERLHAEKKE